MLWTHHEPKDSVAHMTSDEAVISRRAEFLRDRPNNLDFLFRQRYSWMNEYTENKDVVFDLGAGLGMSRLFIENPNLVVTDITKYPWVDRQVDALNLPFESDSVDVFICGHMIHHLGYPVTFFEEIRRILKPGGVVVIQELETSFMLKFLMWVTHNEGWDERVDVTSPKVKCTPGSDDPWSANCAIPHLLFSNPTAFEHTIPGLKIVRNELCEFFIFALSGGVLVKVPTIQLPRFLLKFFAFLDSALIAVAPSFFALGRRVVIKKT